MSMTLALMGNQNSGKTTLFNQLTGSNQHVGNFPGVTVEKKEGAIKKHRDVTVVDLPGIYSLSPYTSEEMVSRNFLLEDKPDAILNIVDATNLERNLYLTLQLMELNMPMVLALNMMDEVIANGDSIDVAAMEAELGIPVVPISASKNQGVAELVERVLSTAEHRRLPKRIDFCEGPVHNALHAVAHLIGDRLQGTPYSSRFASSKLIEGDEPVAQALRLSEKDRHIIGEIIEQMEKALGTDREAALVDMRYTYIEGLCAKVLRHRGSSRAQERSERLDRFLTHRFLAIPIFLCIMGTVFYLTFGPIGSFVGDLFSNLVDGLIEATDSALSYAQVSPWLQSLVVDGVLTGVGSVLSFLPTIVLLFFFLSLLEDGGYMARVAFVMDRLLRKLGLSGRSFVPALIGFGCSVPAIMATRTLPSARDRRMTIVLTPFMSCSAKLPIYAAFTTAFFPQNAALVMIALYLIGITVAILCALLLKKTVFRGEPVPFVMELPNYRMPTFKTVMLHMWEKAEDFIRRAFTILFLASIVIWFLQSLDFTLNLVHDNARSILAAFGSLLVPVFRPLGFGDWQASTALITGLIAKEGVVTTLSILLSATNDAALYTAMQGLFSPLSAFSFLTFTLLYMPCVAAFAATRRELGSLSSAILTAAFQTGVAWVVALIVFQAGQMLGLG